MNTSSKIIDSIRIRTSAWNRFMQASQNLLDSTEEILEEADAYKPEFLSGLRKSVEEHRAGKSKRVTSLLKLR